MASLAAVCRASTRRAGCRAVARGFATSTRRLAAHNFTMPALSPTMTEGNIASWKVKDGEPFGAGDVLLEIETDKATMDVEAQDDGVMVKVMSPAGSKAVQVGTRIAVIADPGDDVASLEIPADEQPKKQSAATASEGEPAAAAPEPAPASGSPQRPTAGADKYEQKYPLMPAVEHLVKKNGLAEADVRSIKPTGPNGRLLKGDVLAFLGAIGADSPAAVSSRLAKLSHLDLTNIKVASAKPAPAAAAAPESPSAPRPREVRVPVSLAKAVEVQRRVQDSLGIFLPLSTFIGRAAEVANDGLPRAARAPSAAELFDQVLGLDKARPGTRLSRGAYFPQLAASIAAAGPPSRPRRADDLIDQLGRPRRRSAAPSAPATVPGLSSGANVFSLVVPPEEEHRARIFLERCKSILEQEPGRLVL
ncbi:hypothetical protein CDD83_10522 [Cordyceps sp. RAO-2017]|nr:hypothetical protein CDD83_10522 [Cordyceps sp. RAO-2017]